MCTGTTQVFSKVEAVRSCSVSRKKNTAGALLSMGFGFVEYRQPEQAQRALKQLQGHIMDGHKVEVRISERATKPALTSAQKQLPQSRPHPRSWCGTSPSRLTAGRSTSSSGLQEPREQVHIEMYRRAQQGHAPDAEHVRMPGLWVAC
ncbi:putative RNA-binding protein 19 isoform 2-T2 [Callospermophilus lateralis]